RQAEFLYCDPPLVWGRVSNPPSFGIHGVSVDPEIVLPTFSSRLIAAILLQQACSTRAGLKPAPTSVPTALCLPSSVCGSGCVRCDSDHPTHLPTATTR